MVRNLCLILGDQLDRHSAIFDAFQADVDLLWMAEVREEATHVWSHQQRIALFLAGMRHFAAELRTRELPLRYHELGAYPTLATALAADIQRYRPVVVRVVRPGDWRVAELLREVCGREGVRMETLVDRHFLTTPSQFKAWATGRRELRMEYWYREVRRQHGVLLDDQGQPEGGRWNYDDENRGTFGRSGPRDVPPMPTPIRDAVTMEVLALVAREFAGHPGRLEGFAWPVTPAQAEAELDRFIANALPRFGPVQDAMWTEAPFLWHSRLAASLNLKLLNPAMVIARAEAAYRQGLAPLASVEGFIRQIAGWREYVRGMYWLRMPGWLDENVLGAAAPLPAWYWTGDVDMACLRACLRQTLEHGYAHHIQRLMVTGLFALLYGVAPHEIHGWYLAIYVDAVAWVELPNTLGMSQYVDGGVLASKPYIASGKYIQKMSNYCRGCVYDPGQRTGPRACPVTTLYWAFLDQHEARFAGHPRMAFMLAALRKLSTDERDQVRRHAAAVRARYGASRGASQ